MTRIKLAFVSIFLSLATFLSGCGSMGSQVSIPIESEGRTVNMDAALHLPDGKVGPFPVIIFSHGSAQPWERMASYQRAFDVFLEKGYAVLYFHRRGYGGSGGQHNEPICRSDTNESGLRAAVRDVGAVLKYVKTNGSLDSSRIVLAGQSRGGMLSTVAAAFFPGEGIRGVVSFSGGWTSCFREFNHGALKFTSRGAKVKNLWLYSQGDTYVSEEHARGYADTFTQVGGDLEFKMYPSSAGGHAIYDYPDYWKGDVSGFLEKIMR
jgi:dienelactone hydrolase